MEPLKASVYVAQRFRESIVKKRRNYTEIKKLDGRGCGTGVIRM